MNKLKILTISTSISCFMISITFLRTDRKYCVLCASRYLNITIKEAYVLRNQYFAELDFLTNLFMTLGIIILISGLLIIYIQNLRKK